MKNKIINFLFREKAYNFTRFEYIIVIAIVIIANDLLRDIGGL